MSTLDPQPESATKRVFVAGGTGVLGRPTVEALVRLGHDVTATTSRAANLSPLEALGARPVVMEGLDGDAVRRSVLDARPDVVINLITALAAPAKDYASWLALTNRLRKDGTELLMAAALEAGTRRVVAQSASFMTHPSAPAPTDESSPLYLDAPGPIRSHVEANIAAEKLVVGTPGIDGIVLRYGFLYGKGTAVGPGGDWAEAVSTGALPIVGDGAGRYPFISVRDAVSATVRAVQHGDPGVYNIVDDDPAAQAVWIPYLAELLHAPPPKHISPAEAEQTIGVQAVYYGTQLPAAGNATAKSQLGMTLEHPSWRSGFRELFS